VAWSDTPRSIGRLLESNALAALARIGLTCAYWWGGFAKLADFAGARAEATHFFGSDLAVPIAVATILVELVASGLVIAGRLTWLAAGALAVFTALATYVAHDFWNVHGPDAHFREFNTFLEHIGLIGGLALATMLTHRDARGQR
jgi:transmembrane protein